MMRFTTQFLLFILMLTVSNVQAQPGKDFTPDFAPPLSITGYKLVWNDEFNRNGQPDSNWNYEKGFVRNNELQWYQSKNAFCRKGVLIIQGRKEKIKNKNYDSTGNDWRVNRKFAEYSSASIQTKLHQQWQYGRFEIRARIDTAKGAWPAIWTLGVKGSWPANGEIDIMEFYRIKNEPTILANVAWGTKQPNVAKWHTETTPLNYFTNSDPDWPKKFHVWKMDWDKDSINIYLDDKLINATNTNATLNADGTNPFRQPHFLLLNLALGGNGGEPGFKNSIQYEVDYVRVYQKNL